MKIDKKLIKELSEYLDEFKLTEIEFTEKDTKIKVSKNNVSINSQPSPNIPIPSNVAENTPKKLMRLQEQKLYRQLLVLHTMPQNLEQKNL